MSAISEIFEYSNGITAIITAVSTAVLATCATIGLRAWRTEHKEKAKWDVAKKAAISVRKIKSGIEHVRFPYPALGEIEEAKLYVKNKMGYSNNQLQESNDLIMLLQWRNDKKLAPHRDTFIDLKPEIDAVCKIDIDREWSNLLHIVSVLFDTLGDYAELKGQTDGIIPTDKQKAKLDKYEKIIFTNYSTGQPDNFTKQVNEAVEAITKKLEVF